MSLRHYLMATLSSMALSIPLTPLTAQASQWLWEAGVSSSGEVTNLGGSDRSVTKGSGMIALIEAGAEFVDPSTTCDASIEGSLRWWVSGSTAYIQICRSGSWIGNTTVDTAISVLGSNISYNNGAPSVTRTYTVNYSLRNIRTYPIVIDTLSVSNAVFFKNSDNCTGTTLTPNATCSFSVSGSRNSNYTGTLSISATGYAETGYNPVRGSQNFSVSLQGWCITASSVAIGTQSSSFCNNEGVNLVYAGSINGRSILFSSIGDDMDSWWAYYYDFATSTVFYSDLPAVPNCYYESSGLNKCSSFSDGKSYTQAIASPSVNYYPGAAKICIDKGPGWYLPSLAELNLLWINRNSINLSSIGINNLGHFYVTSTEYDHSKAWRLRFSDGLGTPDPSYSGAYKNYQGKVRCAREGN